MRCRPELIALAAALLAGGPAHAAPGDLDVTFGDGGLVALHRGPGNHTATDVLAQPDGRIVATGLIDSTFALARLEPDGQLDATFAAGGTCSFPIWAATPSRPASSGSPTASWSPAATP